MVHWTIGTTRQIGFCKWSNGPLARFTPFHDLHHLQDVNPTKLYLTPTALVDHLQPFTAIGNSLIVNGPLDHWHDTTNWFCKWSNGPLARFTPFTGCKSHNFQLNPRALVDHLQPFTAIGNSLIVNGPLDHWHDTTNWVL